MTKMQLLVEIECDKNGWKNFKKLIQKTMDNENITYNMSDQEYINNFYYQILLCKTLIGDN